MKARTGRFERSERVRQSVDYRRVSRTAVRHGSREFVVLVAPMGPPDSRGASDSRGTPSAKRRLGLTVSRKVGNAVARNHVKRRVREWFRAERDTLPEDVDMVVIAKRGAAELDSAGIAASLGRAIASSPGKTRARRQGGRHG